MVAHRPGKSNAVGSGAGLDAVEDAKRARVDYMELNYAVGGFFSCLVFCSPQKMNPNLYLLCKVAFGLY
jgi:hypothetical protein